jgi:hypothetical protein
MSDHKLPEGAATDEDLAMNDVRFREQEDLDEIGQLWGCVRVRLDHEVARATELEAERDELRETLMASRQALQCSEYVLQGTKNAGRATSADLHALAASRDALDRIAALDSGPADSTEGGDIR